MIFRRGAQIFLLAPLVLLAGLSPALAEERSYTVAQAVSASGEPSSAFIVAAQGNQVLAVAPALALPGLKPGEILVVGQFRTEGALDAPVSVVATVELKDGSVASSTAPLSKETAPLGAEAIRAKAAALRGVSATPQGGASGKLAQVNAEADELLKLERAIGGDEAPADPEGHRRRLVELRQLVKQWMSALGSQPVPPAFKKRQSELSAQLNTLTLALRTDEARRRDAVDGVPLPTGIQEQLDLIESTKDERIDVLRKELLQLRKEREALEQKGEPARGSAASPPQ